MLDFPKIQISINDVVFLKNPESSKLGKKILQESIDLIYKLGFDGFTFGKLAKQIGSPEASIYRYFESKHKLLLYLSSWYWTWLEYKVVFATVNVQDAKEQLARAIEVISNPIDEDDEFSHINKNKLHQLVICEASKSYLPQKVDKENREGAFQDFKHLVARISGIIRNYNPSYKYPEMLVSTVLEGTHLQHFFAKHLPSLTNNYEGENSIALFYTNLILKSIDE